MVDISSTTNEGDLNGLPVELLDAESAASMRKILLRLATAQDEAAAAQAARTPYWKPWPESAIGCKAAARALRAIAESLSVALPRASA
jgi:hypothetical protein